ncbi:MAG: DJ-1/PfpI family protein [Gammaproteobacteria bacterium]|nr:DJ-1/PfpI family protein [Gammaproteobacteria bacterium]MCW8922016.1 DJ-1/PfpI family protein [Gammaproteobacteria bacterium]
MSRALVPLAQGCEELEAITITDLLVRAGIEVTTAGLDDQTVTASRGTRLIPDTNIDSIKNDLFDLVVLPGGLPGADYLRDDPRIQSLLKNHAHNHKLVAAICAAPRALAAAGLLEGKQVTGYPGSLNDYPQLNVQSSAIEIDGQIITSRGPGTAMDFALTLIEQLEGRTKRDEIEQQLVR